jgi:hypothetical protein
VLDATVASDTVKITVRVNRPLRRWELLMHTLAMLMLVTLLLGLCTNNSFARQSDLMFLQLVRKRLAKNKMTSFAMCEDLNINLLGVLELGSECRQGNLYIIPTCNRVSIQTALLHIQHNRPLHVNIAVGKVGGGVVRLLGPCSHLSPAFASACVSSSSAT